MKLTYLGTAASEGWPALFCDCPICREAARRGGKDQRYRSCALIDDDLLIDVSPDIFASRVKLGVSLARVRTLLITHPHSDHFAVQQLGWYAKGFAAKEDTSPLLIGGSEAVRDYFRGMCKVWAGRTDHPWLTFQVLKPFEPTEIGGARVTLLPALHGAEGTSSVYRIERDGKAILYLHDTGGLSEDVWDYLRSLKSPAALISLDAVRGPRRAPEKSGHLSFVQDAEIRARMLEEGIGDENTLFVSNHICIPDCRRDGDFMFYDDMVEFTRPLGLVPAYDGMTVAL